MREVGHAGRDINDRYTHVLIEAHLAAAEQTAALIRGPGRPHHDRVRTFCVRRCPDSGRHWPVTRAGKAGTVSPQVRAGGAGGARTHDRRIMSPLL